MSETKGITPEKHKQQIDAYTKILPEYKTYAAALERVLKAACRAAIPAVQVQSRPKSVSSFAEKCARKYAKYRDPVNDFTDLCGARVIVQTLEQVRAVRKFIEANFEIVEKDDKGLSLGEEEFGYRDLHYIVRLRPGHGLGLAVEEIAAIGDKRAEVQVRTWVQHAWADTLHDRMYKAPLKYPAEFRRTGALLAALMEDGDRTFDRLALEIDGMLANYSAFASKEEVEKEVAVQELILANESDEGKKPQVALHLARLVAALGDFERVVRTLQPYAGIAEARGCGTIGAPHCDLTGAQRCELILDLGYALCRVHRAAPKSEPYRQGQELLEKVAGRCPCGDLEFVRDLRKCTSLRARALARLAWTCEVVPGEGHRARSLYAKALETEPGNPYYLADVLGYEIHVGGNANFIPGMAATLREAIRVCREHALNGTELPYACFTDGRLHLLLGEAHEALAVYGRGIRYMLDGTHCVPPDVLDAEEYWIRLVVGANVLTGGYLWATRLLELARRVVDKEHKPAEARATTTPFLTAPLLIVSGGAVSLEAKIADLFRPMLSAALEAFHGTVVSGGTTVGIPGMVGEVAAELANRGARHFALKAYVPRRFPRDGSWDSRYDDPPVTCDEDNFSPEQIMRTWKDIFDHGIQPKDVSLIGLGGGPLSRVEYTTALAFGASVAVIQGSGGSADALAGDPLWTGVRNLLVTPFDPTTVRAFIVPPSARFEPPVLEDMAKRFHKNFVDESPGRLPENMRPWDELKETFQRANREQASYAVTILEASGFEVHPSDTPVVFSGFTEGPEGEIDRMIDRMAEMEHGRWNVERLRDGWRFGRPRDDARKIHHCIIPWADLPESVRHFDRIAVLKFPEILAKAGLEVLRRASG